MAVPAEAGWHHTLPAYECVVSKLESASRSPCWPAPGSAPTACPRQPGRTHDYPDRGSGMPCKLVVVSAWGSADSAGRRRSVLLAHRIGGAMVQLGGPWGTAPPRRSFGDRRLQSADPAGVVGRLSR